MVKVLKYDNPHARVCSTRNSSDLPFINPTTCGLFGQDHHIIDHNSKMALSNTSKLGHFLFYLLDTFWQNFSKIDSPRGVAAVVFERRCLEKLNIIYIQFFLFCFETMEMHT